MTRRPFDPITDAQRAVLGLAKKPPEYRALAHYLETTARELGLRFVPEHRFHAVRLWRFDWAFPELRIAVEYEGVSYQGGRSGHRTIAGFQKDCSKYNAAAIAGWCVLRYTVDLVRAREHSAVRALLEARIRHESSP